MYINNYGIIKFLIIFFKTGACKNLGIFQSSFYVQVLGDLFDVSQIRRNFILSFSLIFFSPIIRIPKCFYFLACERKNIPETR